MRAAQAQLALDEQERPGTLDLLQGRYGQPDWGSFVEEDSLAQNEEFLSVVPMLKEGQDTVYSLLVIYQEPGQVAKPIFFRRDGVRVLLHSAAAASDDYEAAGALDSLFLLYDDWLNCGGGELQNRCGLPDGCRASWLRRLWLRIKRGLRKAFHTFYDVNNTGPAGGPTFVHGIFNVGGGSNSGEGPNTGGSGSGNNGVCVPAGTLDVFALGEMIDALMGYLHANGLADSQMGLLLEHVNPICLNEQPGTGFTTCVENSLRCVLVDEESPCAALLELSMTSEEVLWLLEHLDDRREAESTLCELARGGHHVLIIDRGGGESDSSVEIGILPYSCRSFDLTKNYS